MNHKLHKKRFIQKAISSIFLLILIPFIIALDIFVELYHRIGFRLCNIKLIKRSQYIKIDRHKLKYLNILDKFNCAYCGYANGFAKYITEIAAKTEEYWCGIKHKKTKGFHEQEHQKNFLKYNDEKAYQEKFNAHKKKK